MDLIARLPHELLVIVFSTLTTEELATVTTVSPTWHDRITQCGKLWESFTLNQTDHASWSMIPIVGKHVKNLYYTIKTLRSITDNEIHGEQQISQNTHQVYRSKGYSKILESFPEMTCLEVQGLVPADFFSCNTKCTIHHRHLATLILDSYNNTARLYNEKDMLCIQRQCPGIKQLFITRCTFRALRVIERFQNMEVVVANLSISTFAKTISHDFLSKRASKYRMAHHNSDQQCIRSMKISATHSEIMGMERGYTTAENCDISNLIVSNAHSLEDLTLSVTYSKMGLDEERSPMMKIIQWDLIFSTFFDHLTTLQCQIPFGKQNQFATMIRQHCPALMDCSIVYWCGSMPDVVIDALSEKPMLRQLFLRFRYPMSFQAFEQLLENNYRGKNGIRHLGFDKCYEIPSWLVNLLATAQHALRGIEMNYTRSLHWTAFANLIKRMDRCDDSLMKWIIYSHNYFIVDETPGDEDAQTEFFQFEMELNQKDLLTSRQYPISQHTNVLLKIGNHSTFAQSLEDAEDPELSGLFYDMLHDRLKSLDIYK